MKKFYPLGIVLLAILISSCTKHKEDNDINAADHAFITEVSKSYRAEIAAAELAAVKSDRPAVRTFGQTIVNGYKQANEELEKLAASLQLEIDDSNVHMQSVSRLNGLAGYSLDTAYMNGTLQSHQKIMSIYQSAFNDGNNATIKGYVHRYVDMIRMHYLEADRVARSL